MSKLDDIFDELLKGKYEATDPHDEDAVAMATFVEWFVANQKTKAKQQIKDLFLELTNDEYEAAYNRSDHDPMYEALVRVRQKVNEL